MKMHTNTIGIVLGLAIALALSVHGQAWAQDGSVSATDHDTFDITVQDEDLAQVLQMLSIESEKNIIASKQVSATVSANLFNVTFYEALDAILRVNNYKYIEEGNFIYIYTLEEYDAIMAAQLSRESRIFELDYLSAADARDFMTPLLSTEGQISVRGEVAAGFRADGEDGGADSYAYNVKVVVNDYPDNLDGIAKLLSDLDIPPQQVLIEATVLQTALTEENAFGIDFSFIGSVNFTDLANPLSGVDDLLIGNTLGSDTEATDSDGFQPGDSRALAIGSTPGQTGSSIGSTGGLKVGVVAEDIAVFLRVLDSVTDSTLLARPKLMALNRQRAVVRVAREEGYLGTENTRDNGTTSQEVEFLESGIILAFRPFISRNGAIRMELSPEVSSSFFTISDGRRLPNKATNELATNVRVSDGETIVLGGLFQEDVSIARRQVPGLGDIPVLGEAFKGQDDLVTRREITFLITPTIIHDEKLWDIGSNLAGKIDDVRLGARQGLLPFSRDKLTLNYNKDAWDAFHTGDTEKALYYANNSLRMNTHQPEMLRFKEEITGQKMKIHERSLYERLLAEELGE